MIRPKKQRIDPGTTPEIGIRLPEGLELNDLQAATISFKIKERVVFSKSLEDISSDDEGYYVKLTQTDTLKLPDNEILYIQLHIKDQAGNTPLSETLEIQVGELFEREEI